MNVLDEAARATEHSVFRSRREFLGTALVAGTAVALGGTRAAMAQQGDGYITLDTPVATRDPSTVEVLEFFWFGCPHCYAFEPTINAWKDERPDYVSFVREAPPLNPSWETHSRAFYAAEALKLTDGFLDPMFNSIHQDRKPMRKPEQIADLIDELELDVDGEKFTRTMNSFSVETALRRSVTLAREAGITGVPSILINGKYVTGNALAGGHRGIVAVIDRLVAEEHAAS